MLSRYARRLWTNLGTLILALALAVAVWVSSVVAADPNIECSNLPGFPLEIGGLTEGLKIIENIPSQIAVELRAPTSICDQIIENPDLINVYVELFDLTSGMYELEIQLSVHINPVRIINISPSQVSLSLEALVEEEMDIDIVIHGEPALGFRQDRQTLSDSSAKILGPQSIIDLVNKVQAVLDISSARETVSKDVNLEAVDENGQVLDGVTIVPESVEVSQVIVQTPGFRELAVKVEIIGQVASGYRVTNISVFPQTVTVFSANPQLVAEMPGVVSTNPLDLTGISDFVEERLTLDLPDGVSLFGDVQSVQVQVGIAPFEGSIVMNLPVEAIGLALGLSVELSPDFVNVVLSGPLPILELLDLGDILILVNLTDLEEGTHLVELSPEILQDKVIVESIAPETIEVIISISVTPQISPY